MSKNEFFSLSLNRDGGSTSPKHQSEFPALTQIPSNKILEQVTSEARNLKRRRELPSQKGMVSDNQLLTQSDPIRGFTPHSTVTPRELYNLEATFTAPSGKIHLWLGF